jgi:hypothetical protein
VTVAVLLLGPPRIARGDAIARQGPILWWVRDATILRSDDGGTSWRPIATLSRESDGPDDDASEDSDDDDGEARGQVSRLLVLGDTLVAAGPGGLWWGAGRRLRLVAPGPCRDLTTDGGRRVAALCRERLLMSEDGAAVLSDHGAALAARSLVFRKGNLMAREAMSTAAAGSGDILSTTPHGLTDEAGQIRLAEPVTRVRADGDTLIAWSIERAWISTRAGERWAELEDAVAYDLIDLVGDGHGGVVALTDVGVARLAPGETAGAPGTGPLAGRWPAARLSLAADWRDGPLGGRFSLFGVLTLPLDAAPAAAGERARVRLERLRCDLRGRAARLRTAARRIREAAATASDGRIRTARRLRAQRLAAEAVSLVEAAP